MFFKFVRVIERAKMTEQKKSLKKEKKCLEMSKMFFKFVRESN